MFSHFGPSSRQADPGVPIGVVAQRSGCGIETIRFYERAGVLPRAMRTESGRRVYDDTDIAYLLTPPPSDWIGIGIGV
ncbi:MAG: hypothetical protein B7Z58_17460 [Acidiphilium sp. 37-64-53]|nr:MAG: hypothetical protein B7Z58_17460 [Acidiphilium sp. 37-64-53]OZB24130.1 MAG: hypothetical protein B7X49_15100 [Acidiphilium sp. 34-64-41]